MIGIPALPADAFDAAGAIGIDLPCKRCGYNLRGLRPEGYCPECGTPVGRSTAGDLLRFADPQWVARVARGLSVIFWTMLLSLPIGCIGGAAFGMARGLAGVQGFAGLLQLAIGLVGLYGVWLLSERDPSGIGEDRELNARRIVRIASIVGLVNIFIGLTLHLDSPGPQLRITLMVLAVIASLIGLVGEFARYVYYEKLARRIPDDVLARRARFLKWGFTSCLGASLLAGAIVAAVAASGGLAPGTGATAGSSPATGALIMCLAAPIGLAYLVFAAMTFFLIINLGKRLREEAGLAEVHWASVAPSPASGRAASPNPPSLGGGGTRGEA